MNFEHTGLAGVGVSKSNTYQNPLFFQAANGYGYRRDGAKAYNGGSGAYGDSYADGDTIGVEYNTSSGEITFYKNSVSQGVAYTITPNTLMYPAVGMLNINDIVTFVDKAKVFKTTRKYNDLIDSTGSQNVQTKVTLKSKGDKMLRVQATLNTKE